MLPSSAINIHTRVHTYDKAVTSRAEADWTEILSRFDVLLSAHLIQCAVCPHIQCNVLFSRTATKSLWTGTLRKEVDWGRMGRGVGCLEGRGPLHRGLTEFPPGGATKGDLCPIH